MDEAARADPEGGAATGFHLGFVPGTTPARWARTFQQRHPGTALHLVPLPAAAAQDALLRGDLDAALLRPPVDRTLLHAIVLYAEEPVVLVPRDHLLAALEETEEVAPAELADEVLLQPADDVLAWRGRPGSEPGALAVPGRPAHQVPEVTADAVALVAAGVGVLVVPRSLARLHHRKDVVARPLSGAPTAPVALAWVIEREDERVEDMVGIVRGRTVNSTRGRREEDATTSSAARSSGGSRGSGASGGSGGRRDAGRRAGRPGRGRRPRRR